MLLRVEYTLVNDKNILIVHLGTMSGGGTRVCKGKMGSAVVVDVDPKDVEDWQKQLDNVSHLKLPVCQYTRLF